MAEAIDDMARELRAACASHTATVIHPLLKLQYASAEEPRRGWQNTVRSARLLRHCPYTLEQIRDADWWPVRAVVNA